MASTLYASPNPLRGRLVGGLFSILLYFTPLFALGSHSPALDFDLPRLNGKYTNPTDFKGKKPVYLKFWASWCKPCMKEMPHLQHTQEQYADDIEVIAVNIEINETKEAIEKVKSKFGLTMPIGLDENGSLAKSLNFIGTPFHVLIDQSGNVVHKGHAANKKLDKAISKLASGKLAPLNEHAANEGTSAINTDNTTQILFFTATWCDWYLQDTRPAMSQACVDAQTQVSELAKQYPKIEFKTVVSHLWTGEEEIEKYRHKYQVSHPTVLDKNGDTFFDFGIKHFPTFVVISNGDEIHRTESVEQLSTFVQKF